MHGQTALIKAATEGLDKSLHKLINAGADMYVTDKIGETAFCTSARHGHNTCLRKLINSVEKGKCTFLGLNTGVKHCNAKAINQSALIEISQKLKSISLALLTAFEGKQEGIAKLLLHLELMSITLTSQG